MKTLDIGEMIRESGLSCEALSEDGGPSAGHLRHISAGTRKAGLDTRRKLLAAFEERQKRMGRIIVELRHSINAGER